MDDTTSQRRWHHRLLALLFLLGLVLASRSVVAQTTTAMSSLTIVVRDSEAHPLPAMTVKVFQERPAGPARQVASLMTDATGTLTVQRLDPEGAYVVQFHSAAPIVADGELVDALPMQFVDDQNAGREARDPSQLPGFALELRGQTTFTQRFVVGGTYTDEPLVAAVPMFDLAERDDAPPRPIHPLTGQELTPAEARVFTARIGEPWGITPTVEQPISERVLAEAPAASPVAAERGVQATAMTNAQTTVPGPQPWQRGLTLIAIVGLMVSVVLLVVRQRRTGDRPR